MKNRLVRFLLFSLLMGMIPALNVAAQDNPFTEEAVEIEGDGYVIPAIVTMPSDAEGPLPVVVMLHGTASDKNEAGNGYIDMAQKFAENGIASIRFDFAGSGDSERDYLEYTITGAVDDTEAVFDYIDDNGDLFDEERIGLMGWSQGGLIALLAASAEEDDVKALVTWAGTYDMSDSASEEEIQEAEENGFYIREYDWREDTKVSEQWVKEAREIDVLSEFNDYEGPILALHGANDDVVPIEYADDIVNASKHDASEVKIIDNADHTFNIFTDDYSQFEELIELTLEFFNSNL